MNQIVTAIAAGIDRDPVFAQAALTHGANSPEAGTAVTAAEIRALCARLITEPQRTPTANESAQLAEYCRSAARGITHIMGQSELGNSRVLQHARDLETWSVQLQL